MLNQNFGHADRSTIEVEADSALGSETINKESNSIKQTMGKAPVVVQGTAVASPYDHTTSAAATDQPAAAATTSTTPRDPDAGGEKQVCSPNRIGSWLVLLCYELGTVSPNGCYSIGLISLIFISHAP